MTKINNKLIIIAIAIIIFIIGVGISNINANNKFKGNTEYNKSYINKNSKFDDIRIESEKINIYVFWGDGCPHCEELLIFLENIYKEYKEQVNIYAFEVWYNNENGKIMDLFLDELDGKVGSRSVPYFIIGDKSFEGYTSNMDEEIINTIISKYKNRESINKFENIFN